ncbi:acetolactate synthase 2 small subunit [Candidatus Fukatsuia symbiotica]|uniref:Acetolactate synthase 2 small subunit n=1 Tax=Candidatus Fukatsuia symbiotica TaxID=1878942 RepID=A0A2U8I6P4_9GAMM|nr:acetolactate synthase 2 small subunit [Candidatus Fukatsuia symbiotica]AWK14846.1 acetolactate synthase 2 small subunit [Candidatus Fukatsuia symbiotica]MEA9445186.1 acetolactate synthase 2 small subunit [Candidatus Fukatsuia symbiotica]
MRQHQISIKTRFRPEIIERVLRVVRHRGFCIHTMNMMSMTNSNINIELTVASQRPVDLLSSQLNKLMDVTHVEIVQPTYRTTTDVAKAT